MTPAAAPRFLLGATAELPLYWRAHPMPRLVTSSPDSRPAITFENVRIGFEEGDILRGVSFQVQERETLVLLGETGTGKTLSLKLAAGL
ncbi:MAG: hypothetical protein WBE70_07135, partial [Candidatus Acidiferrum sp.]